MGSKMPSLRRLVLRIESLEKKHRWAEEQLACGEQRDRNYQAELEQRERDCDHVRKLPTTRKSQHDPSFSSNFYTESKMPFLSLTSE